MPNGWEWGRLPGISNYKPGKTPSTKNPIFWSDNEDEIPWVSISDMEHFGFVKSTTKKITQEAVDQVFKYESIAAGSLLMSFKLTIGKISILNIDAYHNEAIISIQPFSGINRDYLFKILPTRAQAGNTKNALMGNTLNATSLSLLLIPIPPTAEQNRIVAKVDELMALCDKLEQKQADSNAAHQTLVETLLETLTASANYKELQENWSRVEKHFNTLFTTENNIKQLKQTILQLAVMGKLVPQDPNDEPTNVLLEKIAKEKVRLINEGVIREQKPPSKITNEETSDNLPKGWEIVRFGTVTFNRDSERIPLSVEERKGRSGEYDYYGASGVIDSIDDFLFDKPLLLIGEDGANLINRSTPIAFMARGKYWVNNHAHVIDGISEIFLLYLCLHINAINLEPYVTGTAQPKMNQTKMNSIVLALPPIAEQVRIVAKVDELMSLCDKLKERVNDSQKTQNLLADAIVEQAVQ